MAVAGGLRGAIRLTRGRADGILLMDGDAAGAVRSFWALAFCMPILVGMRLVSWAETGAPAQAGRILSQDLAIFVVAWLAFATVSFQLARILRREAEWPRFLVAWSWCSVMQNLLMFVGSLPDDFGAPPVVGQSIQLIAIGWALWLEWYAIRLTLSLSTIASAWIVLIDASIGLMAATLGRALSGL